MKSLKKDVWHTVYVGFGAYSNQYNISLSDEDGYNLYFKKYDRKLNPSIGGNYYNEEVITDYITIAKNECLTIIKNNPLIVIKNILSNTFQAFSVGYLNKGGDLINYIIALSGFIYLMYFKKYIWVLMLVVSAGTFTLFFPPIPTYMYGNYLLIIASLISSLSKNKNILSK